MFCACCVYACVYDKTMLIVVQLPGVHVTQVTGFIQFYTGRLRHAMHIHTAKQVDVDIPSDERLDCTEIRCSMSATLTAV